MARRRIGIFGGTFDPPHLGHLLLAETIREQFGLDEVLFVPCNEPPHKSRADLTEAMHRYAMVVAATLHNPAFTASTIEVDRPGKSYSVDTVRQLREQFPDTALLFVAGLDSFLEIETWKDHEQLLELCDFVVVARPGSSFDRLRQVLPERFHERLVDARGRRRGIERRVEQIAPGSGAGPRIYLSDAVYLAVSATEIRARVRAGWSIRYRVTPEVERYIRSHGLYAAKAEPAEADAGRTAASETEPAAAAEAEPGEVTTTASREATS